MLVSCSAPTATSAEKSTAAIAGVAPATPAAASSIAAVRRACGCLRRTVLSFTPFVPTSGKQATGRLAGDAPESRRSVYAVPDTGKPTTSIRPLVAAQQLQPRPEEDAQVQPWRPLPQVVEIVVDPRLHLFKLRRFAAAAVDLRETSDAGQHLVPQHVALDQAPIHFIVGD